MNKYITEFNSTDISTVNVDLVCKRWNKKFALSTWINAEKEEYRFSIKGNCQSLISKEQALEIVDKLDLVFVKDSLLSSAGIYLSKEFVESEINRFRDLINDRTEEIKVLNEVQSTYLNALFYPTFP